MKKIFTTLILGMFLLTMVSASYGEYSYGNNLDKAGYGEQERLQLQQQFENNYQYQCKTNQTCYYDGTDEFANLEFKIREQKQLKVLGLNFNLEMKKEYVLNNQGEIIRVKSNIWSRLFNQQGIEL